jgi:hypothetical protein
MYVVRATELLDSTRINQYPIQLNLQHTLLEDPTSSEEQIRIVSARFNDQLTGIVLQLNQELSGCPSWVHCELFFGDVSNFEQCLMANSTASALLLSSSHMGNSTKVRNQIAPNQCQLTVNELSEQKFVDLFIENATNPVQNHVVLK